LALPKKAFEGAVGVVVTVCVMTEPLKVTTCTLVTGVGVHVDLGVEDGGSEVVEAIAGGNVVVCDIQLVPA
jgi:ABC-type taurine transport system substrate-binding protein